MLCDRLVRLKIYPTLHTPRYNGSGGPDLVIKNGKSTTSFNRDSHSYSVKILYDIIDGVCLGISKQCIVGYSLACPIERCNFWDFDF